MNALTESKQQFDLSPQSLEEALKFADYLAESSIVPKDFQQKPGNILVAIQWGMELGLKPMQAMQNIAVINGRPSLWGDAVLALVLGSPVCEDVVEYYEGAGDDFTAVCIAKRKGRADKECRFSVRDAKAAGLIGKQGPWTQYRDRMLKMRARAFALRDQFADLLKGIPVAEEIQDYPAQEKDITPRNAKPAEIAAAALPQPAVRDDDLNNVIFNLEMVAKSEGAAALAEEWAMLTKEQRHAIGRDELDRLKAIAESIDAGQNDG